MRPKKISSELCFAPLHKLACYGDGGTATDASSARCDRGNCEERCDGRGGIQKHRTSVLHNKIVLPVGKSAAVALQRGIADVGGYVGTWISVSKCDEGRINGVTLCNL